MQTRAVPALRARKPEQPNACHATTRGSACSRTSNTSSIAPELNTPALYALHANHHSQSCFRLETIRGLHAAARSSLALINISCRRFRSRAASAALACHSLEHRVRRLLKSIRHSHVPPHADLAHDTLLRLALTETDSHPYSGHSSCKQYLSPGLRPCRFHRSASSMTSRAATTRARCESAMRCSKHPSDGDLRAPSEATTPRPCM